MLPDLDLATLVLVALVGCAAGLVDSIVGGGGLIMTPAMLNLFPGVPILNLIATQRSSSLVGTSVAAYNYLRQVAVPRKLMWQAALAALVAAALGAIGAQHIPTEALKTVVLACIVLIAIYTARNRDFGQHSTDTPTRWQGAFLGAAIGLGAGLYNGLVGPGTGTILVVALVLLAGLSLLRASAVAKVVNVAADLSSWLVLLHGGYVLWPLVAPLIIGNVVGSYCGSRLAIRRGNAFIRRVLLIVICALIARLAYVLWTA